MNRIVNTAMTGDETAQHLAVGRVYNDVRRQPGNISLPEADPLAHFLRILRSNNTLSPGFLLQVCVLHFQKFAADRSGRPDIAQGAQQTLLFLLLCRYLYTRVFFLFL